MEHITLEYDDYQLLLDDVRAMGVGFMTDQKKNLSRAEYHNLEDKFNQLTLNGKIPLTLEVFYAHAWKDRAVLDLPDGQKVIQITRKKI
jgi:hypothetical protein